MSRLKRILSSRAKGSRSKDSASVEVKWRSSQNTTIHGRLGSQVVSRDESIKGYEAVFADLANNAAVGLMHRYLTHLNLNYQGSPPNKFPMRTTSVQNEPSVLCQKCCNTWCL